MAGLSSQLGNRYCYYVGAYLKTTKFTFLNSKELLFRDYDIMVDSIEVDAENSTFNQKLSLDLLASTTISEYWGECKWSGSPRNITIKSNEFIEALLEFMGLETYRLRTNWKHVEYLFITSHLTDKLGLEVNNLKTGSSNKLNDYLDLIKKKAQKKWLNININKITESLLRNVLNLMLIIPISSSRLDEVKQNPEFQNALNNLQYINLVRDISIPFTTNYDETATKLMYDDEDDTFLNLDLLGYKFCLSKKVICEIRSYVHIYQEVETIIEIDESNLPFLSSFYLSTPYGFSFLFRQLLNESLNILVFEKTPCENAIILNSDLRILYIINKKWLLDVASKHVTAFNYYKIKDIGKYIGINISEKMLELSIIEVKRQKGIIIDRSLFDL